MCDFDHYDCSHHSVIWHLFLDVVFVCCRHITDSFMVYGKKNLIRGNNVGRVPSSILQSLSLQQLKRFYTVGRHAAVSIMRPECKNVSLFFIFRYLLLGHILFWLSNSYFSISPLLRHDWVVLLIRLTSMEYKMLVVLVSK